MDKILETTASLDDNGMPCYALYPDAGEVGDLDTPTLPAAIAAPVPPICPDIAPVPEPVSPVPAVADVPTIRTPRTRRRMRFCSGVGVTLALVGAGVYGLLFLQNTKAWFTDGAWAARAVLGSTRVVTVLPETTLPDETSDETAAAKPGSDTPTPALPTPEPETDAPPANEDVVPIPVTEVLTRDLSSRSAGGLGLINETPYTPELSTLAKVDPVIDRYGALESIYGKACPAVLILHTHGTEAFADQAETGYHTTDKSRSILQVGKALSDVLTSEGIGVLHCTELFDEGAFDMAYYNAARYIRETLEAHPSIRYILDIHRDAITNADGIGIRPLSVEGDTEYAQLMFVVGTDHGGSGHTEWETNLALAARLQSSIHESHPTLMRDINLRSASFNAQYAPGALLIEAGAACSDLEEAVRSIRLFGEALAAEILG